MDEVAELRVHLVADVLPGAPEQLLWWQKEEADVKDQSEQHHDRPHEIEVRISFVSVFYLHKLFINYKINYFSQILTNQF